MVESMSECPVHNRDQPNQAYASNNTSKISTTARTAGGGGYSSFSWWPFPSSLTSSRLPGSSSSSNIPASTEEALQHKQAPHPDQSIPLPTRRIVSSIPRGVVVPEEGRDEGEEKEKAAHWVYPSEQQFYNALRRKGYTADVESMSTVVQIHNAVNERTWRHICQWEKELHSVDTPRLVRFMGRPNDRSPRAWCNVLLFGRHPPFDRHDWYIDRGDGEEHRYVIDFYEGKRKAVSTANNNFATAAAAAALPSMYLDVRPALDNPQALLDRVRMAVRQALPGIFGSPSTYTDHDYHSNISSDQLPSSKPSEKK